jgi:hypothetical protein
VSKYSSPMLTSTSTQTAPPVKGRSDVGADRAIDAGTTEAMNGAIAIAAIKRRPR